MFYKEVLLNRILMLARVVARDFALNRVIFEWYGL